MLQNKMEDYLKFLHLSDIHFRNKLKNYDFDSELRGELENDLDRIIADIKEINGIFITGDLVFSGKEEEYSEIRKWIEKIANKIHCSFEDIWIVPGNHDVDRNVILKSTFIQDIHKNLRKCKKQKKIDKKLESYVTDRDKDLLIESLTNYNRFAVSFGCETKPEQLFWETTEKSDYKFNDGSVLRLRGMNSALVSNEKDAEDYRLILGSNQFLINRKKGITYLILCHHPPEWLKDRDEFNDALFAKTKIQLFGHKHKTRILPINDTLRLRAGAFHPSRNEDDWLPTYFILALKVEKINDKRSLKILVWQREWDKENKKFESKYNTEEKKEFFSYVLPIEYWEVEKRLDKNKIEELNMDSEKFENNIENNLTKYKRRLVYHYLSLPHNIIQTIASDLDLLEEKDKNLTITELYKAYFKRADGKDQLKELWDKVFYYRKGMMEKENPFKKEGK